MVSSNSPRRYATRNAKNIDKGGSFTQALDPVTDVDSQNEGRSRPVSLQMSNKKESMTEVTSATVSGRNSEKIPQSE